MASADQCVDALTQLAGRLADSGAGRKHAGVERSLSCTLTDLDATFTGRLRDGELTDIVRDDGGRGQIRLTTTSDDLLALVNGDLPVGSAWTSGRLKIDAGVMDLMRLRTLF